MTDVSDPTGRHAQATGPAALGRSAARTGDRTAGRPAPITEVTAQKEAA